MRTLNAALALVLIGTWGVVLASRPDPSRRNFRLMPQMVDALPFESQSGILPAADAGTAGRPAPGTIARGYAPLPYRATPEDAARAGRELRRPFAPSPENLRRGAAVYSRVCSPCHGSSGLGDGPVAKRGVPAPPSLLDARVRALPDGRLFHVVTYGQGNMPAYASQTEREDRWKAILHVRELQAAAEKAR